jgi:mono/diheme cytochrome c family protein
MQPTYRIALFFVMIALGFGSATWLLASQQRQETQNQVQRGEYLVEEVAKCSECHTPRDQNNQLERDHWLQGAPTWIKPVFPTSNWALSAPPLAGLVSYTDEQMERVLEMGEGAGPAPLQPPMHIYHMNHADAQAIIAYLRSLPSRPQ